MVGCVSTAQMVLGFGGRRVYEQKRFEFLNLAMLDKLTQKERCEQFKVN